MCTACAKQQAEEKKREAALLKQDEEQYRKRESLSESLLQCTQKQEELSAQFNAAEDSEPEEETVESIQTEETPSDISFLPVDQDEADLQADMKAEMEAEMGSEIEEISEADFEAALGEDEVDEDFF